MSEEVKQYPIGVTLGVIFGLYAFSLALPIFYLLHRVSCQKASKVILALSIIYASLFVFLNIMAIFDLFFNNREDFDDLFNFLRKFYLGFTIADKAFGFFLFNILINYLESGYYSKLNKFIDGIRRFIYSFLNLKTREKILIFAIGVPIFGALLVILIVFRKHFELGKNPLDYTDILFDCYAVFEIYVAVGFFMYQLIKDCKRKRDENLIQRYHRYSKQKIILKAKKYYNKINETFNELSKIAPIFENNNSNPYYVYLQKQFKKVKETKNYLEGNYTYNNETCYNNTYSSVIINQNNDRGNIVQNLTKPNRQEIKEKPTNKPGENENQIIPLKENRKMSELLRKYKKAARRIDKLKKLYSEIEKESDLPDKRCPCKLVILFIAFSIAIATDFVLPLVFDYGSDKDYFNNKDSLFNKEESAWTNVATGVIGMIVSSIICCPYTIITIYTTTRKIYISGDYLYDKQINDDISLMKTVQLICGYSFAIVYCNLYYWKTMDYKGNLGKPYFYDEIIIPDYVFKQGISIFMIIKVIIIVGSIFAHLYLGDKFVFKNDLAEYNKCDNPCPYDNDNQHQVFLQENNHIKNILENKN